MTLPAIIIIASVLAVGLLFVLLRMRRADAAELSAEMVQVVDAGAFLNLISASEQDYLERNLPTQQFRKIHRLRMLAAIQYAWAVAEQARMLNRIAESAVHDSNSEVAAIAVDLQRNAMRVRLRALQSIPRLAVRSLIPGFGLQTDSVARTCEELTWNFAALARLKSPRAGVLSVG